VHLGRLGHRYSLLGEIGGYVGRHHPSYPHGRDGRCLAGVPNFFGYLYHECRAKQAARPRGWADRRGEAVASARSRLGVCPPPPLLQPRVVTGHTPRESPPELFVLDVG